MANERIEKVLSDLSAGVISKDQAAKLLTPSRKLRGVSVTSEQTAAYLEFVDTGDFRQFAESMHLKTNDAQSLLGRCVRATYEKID